TKLASDSFSLSQNFNSLLTPSYQLAAMPCKYPEAILSYKQASWVVAALAVVSLNILAISLKLLEEHPGSDT
ncbi:12492_t:CDS:2, partial [Racocetra persica]